MLWCIVDVVPPATLSLTRTDWTETAITSLSDFFFWPISSNDSKLEKSRSRRLMPTFTSSVEWFQFWLVLRKISCRIFSRETNSFSFDLIDRFFYLFPVARHNWRTWNKLGIRSGIFYDRTYLKLNIISWIQCWNISQFFVE